MLNYLRIESWYCDTTKTIGCRHQLVERVKNYIVHLLESGVTLLGSQPVNNMWLLEYKHIDMIVLY